MTHPVGLRPGAYYHIYNRGNNGENLFREERNYSYFLKLYAQHIEPVADTYACCLLKNHFHVLVSLRMMERAAGAVDSPSQAFSNLFNGYSKATNKAYARTGSLFEHPFGRIEVQDHLYFARLVTYIHQNPQKHGLVTDFRDWKYSSYHALLTTGTTRLKRAAVLAWFDNPANFRACHDTVHDEPVMQTLSPDDFD